MLQNQNSKANLKPQSQCLESMSLWVVHNITRERNRRPLYEKDLANILHFYEIGKVESGFVESDSIHAYVQVSIVLVCI
jgi:mannose-6-phosphate isomerase class I